MNAKDDFDDGVANSKNASTPTTMWPPSGSSEGADDPRLLAILKAVQADLDAGKPVDRAQLLARHPDLGTELAQALDALAMMHGARVQADGAGAATLRVMDLTGVCLGDFRLTRRVGQGGMGVVYDAVQLSLGRRVALKLLNASSAASASAAERFQREAQAAARLHHTNIVPVYGIGEHDGFRFYAMQYIEGRSLAELVRERRGAATAAQGDTETMPATPGASSAPARHRPAFDAPPTPPPTADWREIAMLGEQAALGLAYAHRRGVLHRDIKPANLLLDQAGTLWIADFGLAKMADEATLTNTGELVGTLRYMAPERLQGRADARSDIYSLGLTLYELAALRPGFEENDHGRLLDQLAHESPPPLRRWAPLVPRDLETVILKAIDKEPERRYATAEDLGEDLRRFLNHEPVAARRPTLWQRTAKWARRHRPLVTTAAVSAACLVVAALGILSWSVIQVRSARDAKALEATRANDNLTLAMSALDEIYIRHGSLRFARDPEPAEVDRELLQKGLRFYEQFTELNRDHAFLQTATARAYLTVGIIQFQLNRPQAAIESFDKAIAGLEGLRAKPDSHDSSTVDLVYAYHSAAVAFAKLDRIAEAETALTTALNLIEPLAQAAPSDRRSRRALTQVLQALGVAQVFKGDSERAEPYLQRALKLQETALVNASDVSDEQSHLASILINLAVTAENRGKDHDGLKFLERALEHQRAASQERPRRRDYASGLSSIHVNFSTILQRLGDSRAAEKHARANLQLREQLVSDAPNVIGYRLRVAQARNVLGNILVGGYRVKEALAEFEQAAVALKQLASEMDDRNALEQDFALTHAGLGACHLRAGRIDEAANHFERTLKLRENVALASSDNTEYQANLAMALTDLGVVRKQQKRRQDAEQAHRRALEIQERLRAAAPDHPRHRGEVAATCFALASLTPEPEASRLRDRARAMLETSVQEDATRIHDLDTLGLILNQQGLVLKQAKKLDEAQVLLVRASGIFESLIKSMPDQPLYCHRLAGCTGNRADLSGMQKNYPEARRLFKLAIALEQSAISRAPDEPVFKNFLRLQHYGLAYSLVQLNDHAAAIKTMESLLAAFPGSADEFLVACHYYILCAPLAQKDERLPEIMRREVEEQYLKRAVVLLTQAVAAGHPAKDKLAADVRWAPLRSRADFQQLVGRGNISQ